AGQLGQLSELRLRQLELRQPRETRRVGVAGEIFRAKRLELDGVDAGGGRRFHQPPGDVEAALVVVADFGHDGDAIFALVGADLHVSLDGDAKRIAFSPWKIPAARRAASTARWPPACPPGAPCRWA